MKTIRNKGSFSSLSCALLAYNVSSFPPSTDDSCSVASSLGRKGI